MLIDPDTDDINESQWDSIRIAITGGEITIIKIGSTEVFENADWGRLGYSEC